MDERHSLSATGDGELRGRLSRSVQARVGVGYWAVVNDPAERWYVRLEGDIVDNEFTVLGRTAAEALRLAIREAHARIP